MSTLGGLIDGIVEDESDSAEEDDRRGAAGGRGAGEGRPEKSGSSGRRGGGPAAEDAGAVGGYEMDDDDSPGGGSDDDDDDDEDDDDEDDEDVLEAALKWLNVPRKMGLKHSDDDGVSQDPTNWALRDLEFSVSRAPKRVSSTIGSGFILRWTEVLDASEIVGFVALDEVAEVRKTKDDPLAVELFLGKSVTALRCSGGLRHLHIIAPSPMVAMRFYHGLFTAVEKIRAAKAPARRRGGQHAVAEHVEKGGGGRGGRGGY